MNYKNKYLLILSSLFSFLTISCQNNKIIDDDKPPFSYYFEPKINEDKVLKVFRNFNKGDSVGLNKNQLVMATAIQGFFSRTGGEYYYQFENNDVWLNDLKDNYGVTFIDTNLDEMLINFKAKFSNKYVLYDIKQYGNLNVARSIAGIKDYLPVDIEYENYVKALGFELGLDARTMSERSCFKIYKDEFNNTALFQQDPTCTQEFLTDYGIAGKYFFFYPKDMSDPDIVTFRKNVHDWAKKDCPIFGWVPNDEPTDVNISSMNGQFTIPSDWARNMSVFACKSFFGETRFKNVIKDDKTIKGEDGKHYVTIMMSDGDNVQTWYNTFPFNKKYLAAPRGNFKMGWSIQPSLIDLGRNILNYIYDHRDVNDFYVCSVSGQGYLNPRVFPEDALTSFTKHLDSYLKQTDLSVVQILDSGPSKDICEKYGKIEALKGGIYCYGDRYAGGHGSIYWGNDKPFVSIRETLWNADTSVIAKRINSYSKDIHSIEAYTAINLHPWSMEYNDVIKLVEQLDEHVEIVTADEFIRLISENVEHTDKILV